MRIGHWQMACAAGDVAANTEAVLCGLERATEERLDIVSFPESFLTGYFSDRGRADRHSLSTDGPEVSGLLARTAACPVMFMVGFNERRGDALRNTVLVAHRGRCLGTYSKAFPCYSYFEPGREFPVFVCNGVRFGVIICADGGYVEPARILALKGARIIFAPHYNYVGSAGVLNHFVSVRADHVARARENGVWLVRGNSVTHGYDDGMDRDGVGYGDSYVIDPLGEIVCRSYRHTECLITADLPVDDTGLARTPFFADTRRRLLEGARALGQTAMDALREGGGDAC